MQRLRFVLPMEKGAATAARFSSVGKRKSIAFRSSFQMARTSASHSVRDSLSTLRRNLRCDRR